MTSGCPAARGWEAQEGRESPAPRLLRRELSGACAVADKGILSLRREVHDMVGQTFLPRASSRPTQLGDNTLEVPSLLIQTSAGTWGGEDTHGGSWHKKACN